MAASLNLIHQTSQRWRFKISQADKLDWKQLEADLQASFPRSSWSLRLNTVASSIVITHKICHQQIVQVTTFLVRDRLVQQINKQGLSISEIPLSETEVVGQVPNISGVHFPNLIRWIVNGLSVSMSLSLLCMSLLLFLIGLFGLFLPLTPGFWLLMLATIVFDMAISVRRPFVQTV